MSQTSYIFDEGDYTFEGITGILNVLIFLFVILYWYNVYFI